MPSNDELFDWISFNEMFGDNSFEDFDSTRMVPDSIGIDNGDRAFLTNSEAVCFGSVNSSLFRQIQFPKAIFKELPGLESDFLVTTFWFGLVAAEENMSPDMIHSKTLCETLEV